MVLYGGPKVFAAGADIKEMADASYRRMAADSRRLQASFTAVAKIPKPVVAAITGYALGGGLELALCADFRVAGRGAKVGQPEIQLGIIPGAGGTQRLPRLIGPARAKDIVFTGRFVEAAEALDIGLVDQVTPDEDVYDVARALVARYATGAALALRAAKQAIDDGLETDLNTGLEIERLHFTGLFATEDQRTGMRSFVENGPGKATFAGRRPGRWTMDVACGQPPARPEGAARPRPDHGAPRPAMTQPDESPDLELVTAALRADSADAAVYARVLTESLGESLPPGCVTIERDRSDVRPDARASRHGVEDHGPAGGAGHVAGGAGRAAQRGNLPRGARGGAVPPAGAGAGVGRRAGPGPGRLRGAERQDGGGPAQAGHRHLTGSAMSRPGRLSC